MPAFNPLPLVRAGVCLAGCWLLLGAPALARPTRGAAVANTYRFDIDSRPLASALALFEQVTGSTVTVPNGASLDGLQSSGVVGVYTADQAIARLLDGTGLRARLTGVNAYSLDVQVTGEGVEVTGAVPYETAASDTATRTYTPLRDVPQAITIVSRAMIAEQSMQSLADVVRYVPGIGMAQGEGNRDAAVFRGNSSTADFFVDGVRDDVQYIRDLYNVERVEALKGPNAMIFGRGGAGGVLNRSLRQADWATLREATLQTGSFENRRVMLDVGDRLGRAAATRLTAMYEDSGSYRDRVGLERYGVNPTFAWALGARTIVRAGYERFHDERTADRGIPSWHDRPFETSASTFFGDPAQSVSRVTVNSVTAGLDHRFGRALAVRNRTRLAGYDKFYQNVYAGGQVTPDGLSVPLAAYNNGMTRTNLFSQTDVTALAATGRFRHTLLVGAEFGRQETDNLRHTGYFESGATSLPVDVRQPRVSVPVAFVQSATDADNHGIATIAAVYAQDQLELSRHLQLVLGLRYDDFRVEFTNNRTGTRFSSIDGLFSPRAGLIVKPIQTVSLYTSYSLTHVPRAGDQLSSLTLSSQALDPEKFTNYEVGAKWDLRPHLSFTAAGYHLNRTNVVVPDPIDPTRSLLVDGQWTRGIEVGLSGEVTRGWRLTGGYAYQDGVIRRALSPSAPAGAVLAQLPRHTFSLWNRVEVSRVWALGVGVVSRDDMFAATDNTVVLPAFVRADAAVFATLSRHLQAQLNVENLFDASYYASANNNFNITPGSPRALRVSITTRF
jgi:catecholate siderophore receptor